MSFTFRTEIAITETENVLYNWMRGRLLICQISSQKVLRILTDIVGRLHKDFRLVSNLGKEEGIFFHGEEKGAANFHLLSQIQVLPRILVLVFQQVGSSPDNVEKDLLDERLLLVKLL